MFLPSSWAGPLKAADWPKTTRSSIDAGVVGRNLCALRRRDPGDTAFAYPAILLVTRTVARDRDDKARGNDEDDGPSGTERVQRSTPTRQVMVHVTQSSARAWSVGPER